MAENGQENLDLSKKNVKPKHINSRYNNREFEGQYTGQTHLSNTRPMPLPTEGMASKDSETPKNSKPIKTIQHKHSPTNENKSFDLVNSSPSDDSSFPENIFFAKAILACIVLAFLAACALPHTKNINVISLYGKGLVELWKRLGNIT
jgi:hypothetical protein